MSEVQVSSQAALEQANGWADGMEEVAGLVGGRFPRSEPRERALTYVRGLLSPVERKNGWQLAEEAGDATPYATQHLLGRVVWSADEVRDDLRAYLIDHLGDQDGVLVVDETGFLKKGNKSAGVQRQYSGTAGRIENCQIGVFLAYATRHGRAFLDRELYLPQAWADDPERRREAGVPPGTKFATKLVLARRMIERAREAGVPFRWVTGDEVYGNDSQLRSWLEGQRIFSVLGWRRSAGFGTGGAAAGGGDRRAPAEEGLAEAPAPDPGPKGSGAPTGRYCRSREVDAGRRRRLLLRRSLSEPAEMAYDIVSAPKRTRLAEMVRVAGTRWAIEESFQTAKGEVGLDQYEVRSWEGWYRHMTLSLLAHAYLSVTRAHAQAAGQKKKPSAPRLRRKNSYR